MTARSLPAQGIAADAAWVLATPSRAARSELAEMAEMAEMETVQ